MPFQQQRGSWECSCGTVTSTRVLSPCVVMHGNLSQREDKPFGGEEGCRSPGTTSTRSWVWSAAKRTPAANTGSTKQNNTRMICQL